MRLWHLIVLLALAGILGFTGWHFATSWRPSIENYPVQGIDVSAASGPIDWKEVAASGADFGYAVATEGANQRDPSFETNWANLADAGMRRGAIHRYSLCQLASDQADAFVTAVPRTADALPPAIEIAYRPDCDARPAREVLLTEIAAFVTTVENHAGKPVLLIVPRSVEGDYRLSEGLARSIWAVGNVFPPSYAARPWRMWRASDFRRIDGVKGPVNWDVAAP